MRDHERDTEFDPLDILLEEVLSESVPATDAGAVSGAVGPDDDPPRKPRPAASGRAPHRSTERSPHRLLTAALAAVGVGVIAWVTWLRQPNTEPRTAAPGQQGEASTAMQDGAPIAPKDFEEVRRLLADLVEVRAASRLLTMRSATDELTFATPPQCEVSIKEPAALQRWREEISASRAATADAVIRSQMNVHVRFELRDGRHLEANASARTGGLRFAGLPIARVPSATLEALLDEAYEEALRNGRRARGIASSLEELRALPAASETVRCPCLTPEQAEVELPRFTALRDLCLVQAGLSQLPGREVIDVLLRIRTLRRLSLPLGVLEDAEIASLAALPELTELELTGAGNMPLACFTGQSLHELPHLRALRLVQCDLTPDGWRSLVQARSLSELHVERTDTPPLPGAWPAFLATLSVLPGLTKLTLCGSTLGDDEVLAQVAKTRLDDLRLLSTRCTAPGLSHLANLATLRELSLRGTSLGDGWLDTVQTLTGLRRLDLVNTDVSAEAVAHLRAALPGCEVEAAPGQKVLRTFSETSR
ncbi:MAG: hypothetical protein R3F56_19530 [Planctomycetota bacterium]